MSWVSMFGIATSWESARVSSRSGVLHRCVKHLIQDYEPYFYPHGWDYALAEDSYRFGFRCLALGPMVAELLKTQIGVSSDLIQIGFDTSNYCIKNFGTRNGVVFSRGQVSARRGYQLGKMALRRVPSFPSGSGNPCLRFGCERHNFSRCASW